MSKKDNLFWIGYSDLLTSLFFVMLVLFSITFLHLKSKNVELKASAEQLEQIKEVEEALKSLDEKYFQFDDLNKRYKLNIDVQFPPNRFDFNLIDESQKVELKKAGEDLYSKINLLVTKNKNIEYLLIIEGNAARYNDNYKKIPDQGYRLSYNRALALFNFWKLDCKIPFDEIINNCEILIAGSGYFGQSREENEKKNKRFTIQITSKVGKFLNRKIEG